MVLYTYLFTQANGLDKRFNQKTQSMLVKLTDQPGNDWDLHLDTCTFAYNTSQHDSSKFSPCEIIYGRRAVLPVQLDYSATDPHTVLYKCLSLPDIHTDNAFQNLMDKRAVFIEKQRGTFLMAKSSRKKPMTAMLFLFFS